MVSVHRRLVALCVVGVVGVARGRETRLAKASGPPSFFLQDAAADGLCLGDGAFKRCGIDTLWYVTGSAGAYSIHKRKVDDVDEDLCLDRASCDLPESALRLGNCKHCGATRWNIVGDAEAGYALSEDGGENCVVREGLRARVARCALKTHVALSLQFATAADVEAMGGDGAKLVGAAGDGDERRVRELLRDGVAVDARDWDGLTALVAAAAKGRAALVGELLGAGADPAAGDKDNITALMEAAIGGHADVAARLLAAAPASLDAAAASGVTALWLAAGEGRLAVAELLLGRGADASNARSDGITALMAAATGGHAAVVAALVRGGADVAAADRDGLTALMNAAENGTAAAAAALLAAGADVDATSATGFTPLIVAAAGGHDAVCAALLDAGADVGRRHDEGVDALMYAAAGGHASTAALLVARGADVAATRRPARNSTAGSGRPDQTLQFSSSVESESLRLMLGRIDRSRRVLEARPKSLVHTVRRRARRRRLEDSSSAQAPPRGHGTPRGRDGGQRRGHGAAHGARRGPPRRRRRRRHGAHVRGVAGHARRDGVPARRPWRRARPRGAQRRHAAHVRRRRRPPRDAAAPHRRRRRRQRPGRRRAGLRRVRRRAPRRSRRGTSARTRRLRRLRSPPASARLGRCLDERSSPGAASARARAFRTARARDARVEATSRHPVPAQAAGDADVEPHKDDVTALQVAAQGGHLACVSLLLDAGADVRAVDEEGMSALANAAQKNHGDVAYELVARGADPDDAGFVDDDAVAHNLLWDAVAAGNEAFAALLVAKGAACGAADARGSTALVNAAHKGLNATVDALLAGGADPAARNDEGVDALIAAASEGHGAVVDSLVAALAAAGAGLDGADKDGTTALMAAAVRGHGAVLDALLAGRAAVDARNGDGHTALMFAYNGKNQVKTLEAKYLKAVGGAPGGGSAVAADSNLEVIAAALAGHEAIVAKLLAAGADPALADNEGHVAADFDYKAPDDEPAAGAGGEL